MVTVIARKGKRKGGKGHCSFDRLDIRWPKREGDFCAQDVGGRPAIMAFGSVHVEHGPGRVLSQGQGQPSDHFPVKTAIRLPVQLGN